MTTKQFPPLLRPITGRQGLVSAVERVHATLLQLENLPPLLERAGQQNLSQALFRPVQSQLIEFISALNELRYTVSPSPRQSFSALLDSLRRNAGVLEAANAICVPEPDLISDLSSRLEVAISRGKTLREAIPHPEQRGGALALRRTQALNSLDPILGLLKEAQALTQLAPVPIHMLAAVSSNIREFMRVAQEGDLEPVPSVSQLFDNHLEKVFRTRPELMPKSEVGVATREGWLFCDESTSHTPILAVEEAPKPAAEKNRPDAAVSEEVPQVGLGRTTLPLRLGLPRVGLDLPVLQCELEGTAATQTPTTQSPAQKEDPVTLLELMILHQRGGLDVILDMILDGNGASADAVLACRRALGNPGTPTPIKIEISQLLSGVDM